MESEDLWNRGSTLVFLGVVAILFLLLKEIRRFAEKRQAELKADNKPIEHLLDKAVAAWQGAETNDAENRNKEREGEEQIEEHAEPLKDHTVVPVDSLPDHLTWNPVLTVDPAVWEVKVSDSVAAGAANTFWVCDFDRTVTKCFLEDGRRSLDCHDILASIPKISRDCKQKMEDMMEYYYPIEIHPSMTREEKIPFMVEWYGRVNALLGSQNLTREDVATAVRNCQDFRIRPGVEEAFTIAHQKGIPVIVVSAGLGNVIEEVIRQRIMPEGQLWSNVRVLSNSLLWDEKGNYASFSDPLIHMYNKSLQDAPEDIRRMIEGRNIALLSGDSTGDLTMAHGHDTKHVLKFGFLNERIEERMHLYVKPDAYDRVTLNDGSFEDILEVLSQL